MKNRNRLFPRFLACVLMAALPAVSVPARVFAAETPVAEPAGNTAETPAAGDTAAETPAGTASEDPAAETAVPAEAAVQPAAETQPSDPSTRPVMDSADAPGPAWPQGPEVHSASAILFEPETGTVLYGKDIHARHYPASITKLMTGLLAYEYLKLDEIVSFSNEAVFGIDRESSNIGIDVGEELTVEQCLHGLLTASANEVAVALSEKVAGNEKNFAKLMNSRAQELGCVDTHFANASGLHDPEHYTSVYDMALIARAFFQYDELAPFANQSSYHFTRSKRQPDDFWVYTLNQLIRGQYEYYGSNILGGKNGFTDEARQTLVTCAEKDGMRLICVVMQAETPEQYKDTCRLLDFGFENFTTISISENEHRFSLSSQSFLENGNDVFGNKAELFSIEGGRRATVPKGGIFENLTYTLERASAPAPEGEDTAESGEAAETGETDGAGEAGSADGTDAAVTDKEESPLAEPVLNDDGNIIMGTLVYYYRGIQVGTANLIFLSSRLTAADSEPAKDTNAPVYGSRRDGITGQIIDYCTGLLHEGTNGTLYVDVPSTLFVVVLTAMILILVITFFRFLLYLASGRRRRRRRARSRARRRNGGTVPRSTRSKED